MGAKAAGVASLFQMIVMLAAWLLKKIESKAMKTTMKIS
jgi:hypothetical protein